MATCKERTLEATSTWAVAVVFLVIIAISIVIEQLIHYIGTWLKKKRKATLYEALEKIKSELMLLGFISFLLAVFQETLSDICVSRNVGHSWFPCHNMYKNGTYSGTYYYDPCVPKGKVQLISAYGIHQLHIFIFALALTHVVYCVLTYGLGKLKMRQWRFWEDETSTLQYQYYHDPERFRYARDTSFGQRHLHFWSKSSLLLWIVCFFRQFFSSVAKVDYMTLRHGFVTAHLPPQTQASFDFQKYIDRSLEEDFKYVVGISPIIWFCAVLFLLTNTNGWYSHFWLPFIPLVILLVVGTNLQVIITKMGRKILDRGDIVKGTPIVEPGDYLFWFNSPRFILFLITFVLFLNAFQLAFLVFSLCAFGYPSCFHENVEDVTIRVVMGVLIHILCSYVTLPLYALVIQMGSTMKPVIFGEQVASALGDWKDTAKKQTKQGRLSAGNSPLTSRPASPLRGVEGGGYQISPRVSNFNNGGGGTGGGQGTSASPGNRDPESSLLKNGAQHEVEITLSDFSNFGQKDNK